MVAQQQAAHRAGTRDHPATPVARRSTPGMPRGTRRLAPLYTGRRVARGRWTAQSGDGMVVHAQIPQLAW